MGEVTRCARCIMDNESDTEIWFYRDGTCNYCTGALKTRDGVYFPDEQGEQKLRQMLEEIKREGAGKKHDCLLGISGGLDSSYLMYLGKKWGLRILCVHVDDGFYTGTARENIDKLTKATGFDCVTIEPDFTQYDALLKAFLKAGVPNIIAPQDNVLFAMLYDYAVRHDVRYLLSGGNFAQESINTKSHGNLMAGDSINIKAIHKHHGTEPIDKLVIFDSRHRHRSFSEADIKTIAPLNYLDYNKNRALNELADFCGYVYYDGKHLENIWTAFHYFVWSLRKFGFDYRTNYYSSMIISGQLTRDEALKLMEEPYAEAGTVGEYIGIIKARLSISDDEFDEIMSAPVRRQTDFENDMDKRISELKMPASMTKDTKAMIFGAGNWGEHCLKALENRCEVIGFYDNDEAMFGESYLNKMVYPPPGNKEYRNNHGVVIVVACSDYKPIIRQLADNGICDDVYLYDYHGLQITHLGK